MAFFSGTDMSTLKEQAEQCNNVLSLVVNNAGSYVAKFTERHKVIKYIAVTEDITTTDSWKYMGEKEDSDTKYSIGHSDKTDDYIEIKCWDCEIDRPLDVTINEDFKKECIEKIDLFKNKVPTIKVSNKLNEIPNKHYYEPYLFNDDWDYNDYNNSKVTYSVREMTNSIFELSFSSYLDIRLHSRDFLSDKYSDAFYYAFLDAWMEFYIPSAEQLQKVIDEINLRTDIRNYDAPRSISTIINYLSNVLEGYLEDEEINKDKNGK